MHDNFLPVSIIIVNYNTPQLLKDCIQSIHAQTKKLSYEIIVVDNASRINPAELFKSEFPNVRFIISPENLGFGKANNLGVQYAQGKYIFFLNSDTILLNDAVSVLFHFANANPSVGICGANLYDGNNKPDLSYFKFPTLSEELKTFFSDKYSRLKTYSIHNFGTEPQRVDCISGADLMIKKETFINIGGFDPDFFLYYEETEMTWRLKKKGLLVYSVPQAKIIHYHGMSSEPSVSNLKKWSQQEFLYSKFLYFQKTGRKHIPFCIKTIYIIKCLCALPIYGLIGRKEKFLYWKDKYQAIVQTYRRYLFFLKQSCC